MAALAHRGGEPRNGEATDDSNYGGILGRSPAHTQRNKLGAVRIHLRHSPDGETGIRQHLELYYIKVNAPSLIMFNAPNRGRCACSRAARLC
jgi:hypothetical protein